MASEQPIANEVIAKAVEKVTKAVIQVMTATTTEIMQSEAGPKIVGPSMKQPNFNWEADDKYSKPKKLQVRS